MNVMDRLVLILLGVWAIIFGIVTVTNIDIVFARPLMGLAALATGVVCLAKAAR